MSNGQEQAVVTGKSLTLMSWVTLGRSHSLSGPQFLHFPSGVGAVHP